MILLWIFLLLAAPLAAEDEVDSPLPSNLTVDLREPTFSDGTLSTDQGGVIQGTGMRIQAKCIKYTKKKGVCCLEAEEDLMLEFGRYVFVGNRIEFDFVKNTGIIYEGRSGSPPWYFGGEEIILQEDGSFVIKNGFVTTSENRVNDWEINVAEATLYDQRQLEAQDVTFRIINVPLFWIPKYKVDLGAMFESPISYYFRWGGKQGTRFGMKYEVYSWDRLTAFLRLDYRFRRGPGGGFEIYYTSPDHKQKLEAVNYVACDNSISNPHETVRYRVQGNYKDTFYDDRMTLNMSWDKLSDRDMASDYKDASLELDYAGRTQIHVRDQHPDYITNILARVKVNYFQTLKQELPSIQTYCRPFEIGDSGVITENLFRAAFLDFSYASDIEHVRDYTSLRLEFQNMYYRPFHFNHFTLTPEAGLVGILYGNSPQHNSKLLGIGSVGGDFRSHMHRYYGCAKHSLQPYIRYQYLTMPSASPNEHYIFDVDDGWYRLNMFTIGFNNDIYVKSSEGCVKRLFSADIYTYAFPDTQNITTTFQKVYTDFSFNTFPTLRHTLAHAWSIQNNQLDHLNYRTEWTISADWALAAEYRHRSRYDWRKADHTNFILDSYRSQSELLHSEVSDRRDTLLLHSYYRFSDTWRFNCQLRRGWNRITQPSYTEYEIDLLTTLRSSWNLRISYQHRQSDDRVALYVNVGFNKPRLCEKEAVIPCLEF